MTDSQRLLLTSVFQAAVDAAHPARVLPPALPEPPAGRIVCLAAGKAAGAMIEACERHYLDDLGLAPERLDGIAVARTGYARPTRRVPCREAGHPVPDAAGMEAAEQALALARAAGPEDLVLVLLSGGGSANWTLPLDGLDLADKQALTRALLRAGAQIGEINTVRKHLSRIKGGRLAAAACPSPLLALAISDVPHDDPSVIASGPTVPDRTTLAGAREVLATYGVPASEAVRAALDRQANETPKPGDACFDTSRFALIARPADSIAAAAQAAQAAGFVPHVLGADLEGEARVVAREHAERARALRAGGERACLISGGELTVTMRGEGRGGPNQEYALAFAEALGSDSAGIAVLAADTDGTDGGGGAADDPAGAFVLPDTLARARVLGLDPAAFLRENDSARFFEALGDLLITGPTHTNVNDLRVALIDFPNADTAKDE